MPLCNLRGHLDGTCGVQTDQHRWNVEVGVCNWRIMHAAFRPRRYAAAVDADELILGVSGASLSKVITLQPTKEAQPVTVSQRADAADTSY